MNELREMLRAKLPEGAVKQHPTKDYLSTVNSMYVIERLNDVFGEDGWFADYAIIEGSAGVAMVVVRCDFSAIHPTLLLDGNRIAIKRVTFGGNDNKDRGDAYKGACTDALTKAASQIGIASDVYKGMYDKELVGDDAKGKKKTRDKKEEIGDIDGIVNEYQMTTPNSLWLKVDQTPVRVLDDQLIQRLKNCNGKRVQLRCRWDLIKTSKRTVMTVLNVMGIWDKVPSSPVYEMVFSQCRTHGQYQGDGNCPKCDIA